MEELISRKAAIDLFLNKGMITAALYVYFMPSVLIERNNGRWYDVGTLSCRCSECGCKAPKEYSFCPNCGADMEVK